MNDFMGVRVKNRYEILSKYGLRPIYFVILHFVCLPEDVHRDSRVRRSEQTAGLVGCVCSWGNVHHNQWPNHRKQSGLVKCLEKF